MNVGIWKVMGINTVTFFSETIVNTSHLTDAFVHIDLQ